LATHFVTGGTGLVGRRLIADLLSDGIRVKALGRTEEALRRLDELGADPVYGDLETPGVWQDDAADAQVLWHLALPRVRTPLRGLRVRKDAQLAWRGAHNLIAHGDPARTVVVASHALAWGDRGDDPVTAHTDPDPVAMGHWGLAAEQALTGPGLRAVRLGWTYGPDGMFTELVLAVRRRQFRIVGDGRNRLPLISAPDAARALRAAQVAAPGVYAASEPTPPTQEELIHRLCIELGVPRPDRVPPRLAAVSLGGPMAEALRASINIQDTGLADVGWRPEHDWRTSLLELSLPAAARR
jgi:nucleoside-diphosphate-sugar epimerase